MPRPTKYWYWQHAPYKSVYDAFLTLYDMSFKGRGSRVATVRRDGSRWYAERQTDPGAIGEDKTRDGAVDDLLAQIGGLG